MNPSTILQHLTLTSGHLRESPRSEVSNHALAACRPLALPGVHSIPGLTGYSIEVKLPAHGGSAGIGIRGPQGDALILGGLAWTDLGMDRIWRELLALARAIPGSLPNVVRRPPQLPALVVMLSPAAARVPANYLGALADFERCWAWALLEDQP